MQFVPIIPRPRDLLKERLEVKRLAAVRAARPVQPRTLPPLLVYPREQHRPAAQEQEERRAATQQERRSYCRRVKHLPVLEELRSAIERRKKPQRSTDRAEHIDVEA